MDFSSFFKALSADERKDMVDKFVKDKGTSTVKDARKRARAEYKQRDRAADEREPAHRTDPNAKKVERKYRQAQGESVPAHLEKEQKPPKEEAPKAPKTERERYGEAMAASAKRKEKDEKSNVEGTPKSSWHETAPHTTADGSKTIYSFHHPDDVKDNVVRQDSRKYHSYHVFVDNKSGKATIRRRDAIENPSGKPTKIASQVAREQSKATGETVKPPVGRNPIIHNPASQDGTWDAKTAIAHVRARGRRETELVRRPGARQFTSAKVDPNRQGGKAGPGPTTVKNTPAGRSALPVGKLTEDMKAKQPPPSEGDHKKLAEKFLSRVGPGKDASPEEQAKFRESRVAAQKQAQEAKVKAHQEKSKAAPAAPEESVIHSARVAAEARVEARKVHPVHDRAHASALEAVKHGANYSEAYTTAFRHLNAERRAHGKRAGESRGAYTKFLTEHPSAPRGKAHEPDNSPVTKVPRRSTGARKNPDDVAGAGVRKLPNVDSSGPSKPSPRGVYVSGTRSSSAQGFSRRGGKPAPSDQGYSREAARAVQPTLIHHQSKPKEAPKAESKPEAKKEAAVSTTVMRKESAPSTSTGVKEVKVSDMPKKQQARPGAWAKRAAERKAQSSGNVSKPDTTKKSVCGCCHCDSINKGEEEMVKDFADIFKSTDDTCPDCGGTIMKGGNKKGKAKGAKKLGNEADPHRGGKTGSMVKQPRGGWQGGEVDREVVRPGNKTTQPMKKSFAYSSSVAVVSYAGLEGDNALSKSIETNLKPGAGVESGLFVPPQRNLAMEQESAVSKAFPPKQDEESGEDESSEASDDSSGDESESE